MRTKVPKAYTKVKHRKVSSGLENSKSDVSMDIQESAVTYTTDISSNEVWNGDEWNYVWSFDGWNDDWSSVGKLIVAWRFGCQCHQ